MDIWIQFVNTKRKSTYLRNIKTPVDSIALEMPFHEAAMLYFCLAVSGSRGSHGAGGGGSSCLDVPPAPPPPPLRANFPNLQPIIFQIVPPTHPHTHTQHSREYQASKELHTARVLEHYVITTGIGWVRYVSDLDSADYTYSDYELSPYFVHIRFTHHPFRIQPQTKQIFYFLFFSDPNKQWMHTFSWVVIYVAHVWPQLASLTMDLFKRRLAHWRPTMRKRESYE